jgi:hypothetical protein
MKEEVKEKAPKHANRRAGDLESLDKDGGVVNAARM